MTPAERLVEEWAAWLRGAGFRRESTATVYRRDALAFLKATGVTDLHAVTLREFDSWLTDLRLEGVAKNTIRSRMYAVRGLFDWAKTRGLVRKNPAALVRLPKDDRKKRPIVVLSFAELGKLFAAAAAQRPVRGKREPERFFERRVAATAGQAERDLAYLRVSYDAALRVGEAARLHWSEVLPAGKDGLLSIVVASSKGSDEPSKPLFLGEETSRVLLAWKAKRAALGRRGASVFGLSSRACAAAFDRCVREAGIFRVGRRLTPHALRSSRATHASEAGLDIRGVADLLRHANLENVEKYVRERSESVRRFQSLATLPEHRGKRLTEGRLRARRRERKALPDVDSVPTS